MLGDPREASEVYLLSKLSGLTIADGLPQPFGLVTRELIHLNDLKPGQLPACFLQMNEDATIERKLSHIRDVRWPGRIIVCFAPSTTLAASVANAYRATIETMIEQDLHFGSLIDACYVTGELQAGLWPDVGVLAIGVLIEFIYEYSPLLPPVPA